VGAGEIFHKYLTTDLPIAAAETRQHGGIQMAVEAMIASDYASVQGFVLMMALLYVLLNLCIDIVYGLVDPRVRLEA